MLLVEDDPRGGFRPEATRAVTRVLLVEDNPHDVGTVERLLTTADTPFDLTSVGRVSDALARLATGNVDVVLLDLSLPDSDPSQTFDRVSAAAHGTPIIILSGQNDKGMAALAVRSGAQDFLGKRHLDGPLLDRSLRYAVERQRYHDALRDSEERYALAVEGANDGLWDWNLRTNEVYYSPRWMSMLGLVEAQVPGRPEAWLSRVHADDAEELRRDIDGHLAGGTDHFSKEHRIRCQDGSYRWMLSRGVVRRDQRGVTRMAGSLTDIHAQKVVEERLRRDALTDALTGLPNWTLFKDRLRAAIAKAKRQPAHRFAVLFLDLDRFKTINDSLGHSNGDKLLVAVSKRVADVLRPGDTIARLGGDEFAVLVEDCAEPSDAHRVADRIHAEFKAPLHLDGHEVFVSTSIGIALSSPRYAYPEECLRDADTAMYRAKGADRGGHAIFDREMHQQAVEQLQLENDLRRAVARREFRVHYQPIVRLNSGSVQGFEALVRWEHPERGLLMPDDFIPMAEDSGLIVPIGWLVFEEACRQLVAWQKAWGETPFVSVNFSSRQIRQSDLIPHVQEVLRRTGCKATDLRVELTETMIMESAESGVDKLASLSNLDLQLYIDDFGTGYSSLSYLQRLPTNALKIDRSFVNEVAEKPQIVGTIIALAKSLKMRVEAEGIETEDQLARLRELGCESGQGFYFSKALTPTAATSLVETQPIH